MERRNFLDRWGDWTISISGSLLQHPTLTVGGATVLLFIVARIPTDLFYLRFGVRPEDVGLDSVQVLLQGSAYILAVSFLFGLIYGFLIPLLILLPIAIVVPRCKALYRLVFRKAAKPKRSKPIRTAFRRIGRLSPILIPVVSLISALLLMIIWADRAADDVKAGNQLFLGLVPWKAIPVEVMWSDGSRQSRLPGCEALVYLGEGNGRVVVYDSNTHETYRINSEDVQLDFPEYFCERPKRADTKHAKNG